MEIASLTNTFFLFVVINIEESEVFCGVKFLEVRKQTGNVDI
jgi:hypothetical protein